MRESHTIKLGLSLACAIAVSACSKDDADRQWTLIDNFTDTSALGKPYTSIKSGGMVTVWQEVEAKTSTSDSDIICTRTNIKARSYNGENWGTISTLQQGNWRKSNISKDFLNPDSSLKWEYIDSFKNDFDSGLQFVSNTNGNGIASWVQNTIESCETTGTPEDQVYYANYTGSSDSWSTAAAFNDADANVFLKGARQIQIAMNSADQALLVWTQAEHYGSSSSNAVYKTDVIYGAHYDGASWTAAQPLSKQKDADPNTAGTQEITISVDTAGTYDDTDDVVTSTPLYYSSTNPAVDINENGDGIIAWKHQVCFPDSDTGKSDCRLLTPDEANGAGALDKSQMRYLIEARRYDNATGWAASSIEISNNAVNAHIAEATAQCTTYDTDKPGVSLDDNNNAWISWEQITTTSTFSAGTNSCDFQQDTDSDGLPNSYLSTSSTTNVYVNSLASDDTIGTATLLQTDHSDTATLDESTLKTSNVGIFANNDGSAIAAWIMHENVSTYTNELADKRYSNRWNHVTAQSIWSRAYDGSSWETDAKLITGRPWITAYDYSENTDDRSELPTPLATCNVRVASCDPNIYVVGATHMENLKIAPSQEGLLAIWRQWDDPRANGTYELQGRLFESGNWKVIRSVSTPAISSDYSVTTGAGSAIAVSWTNKNGKAQAATLD